MKKVKIRDREYNCSNAVYWHIQGLETENRMFSQEIHAHERSEIKIMYENENLERHNKQLKENWNKLKEWLYTTLDINCCELIEAKIQELEKGDSNE